MLPIFELILTDDQSSGVSAVALVDKPAIELNWLMFSKEAQHVQFKATDEDRRIITGALMTPDKPIYRRDDDGAEYYVVFRKETILNAAQRFFKSNRQKSVNMMHDGLAMIDGVTMFESFVSDSARGILPPSAFSDEIDGSWFGSFHVENDKVWNEFIKTGIFQGFSIEGFFDMKPVTMAKQEPTEAELMEAVNELINVINGTKFNK